VAQQRSPSESKKSEDLSGMEKSSEDLKKKKVERTSGVPERTNRLLLGTPLYRGKSVHDKEVSIKRRGTEGRPA